tara:strand:+ start:142 stop:480 length:339 start_codon:yes stop_codon:yes gene_type:complete
MIGTEKEDYYDSHKITIWDSCNGGGNIGYLLRTEAPIGSYPVSIIEDNKSYLSKSKISVVLIADQTSVRVDQTKEVIAETMSQLPNTNDLPPITLKALLWDNESKFFVPIYD